MSGAPIQQPSTYRADIDGLRAIAVLAVALFHAELSFFSGGFVGVDVFFVISGYLITGIVAKEAAEGRFSLWRFYERRLRRIAPALIVVIAAVTLATLLLKTPKEANYFGESVTYAVLMVSNFFFYQETDYFSAPLETFALLHSWSLAVEEQFYLFWPPLLAALVGRRAGWRGPVVWGLIGLSLAGAAIALTVDRAAAFFLSPFRIWELLIGAALALGLVPPIRDPRWREGAAALGLALILAAVIFYDEATPFPGLAALAPTLGAGLILHAGAGGPSLVGRLLSLRPMVFVGLCSYAFYLWHWPVLSFAGYVAIRKLTAPEALGALAVAFLLSVLSLYYVERPFRRPPSERRGGRRLIPTGAALAITGASAAAFIGVGLFLQASKGWPGRFPADYAPLFAQEVNHYGEALRECRDAKGDAPDRPGTRIGQTFCRFGAAGATPDFVVWGDSHSTALFPAFLAGAKASGRAGYLSTFIQCAPFARMDLNFSDRAEGCRAQNAAVFEAIQTLGIRQAVLVASWLPYGGEDRGGLDWLRARAAETVARLEAMGVETLIVAPAPTYPTLVPSAVYRMRRFGAAAPFDLSRAHHEARAGPVIAALAASGAPIMPVADLLCGAEACDIAEHGLPLYTDSNHLNRYGAARLAGRAGRWLASPSFREAQATVEAASAGAVREP